MTHLIHFIQTYGPLAVVILAMVLVAASVVLVSVAHAVAGWDPVKAGKIARTAAVISAVGHGLEGLVWKWPFTAPPMPPIQQSAVDAAKKDVQP